MQINRGTLTSLYTGFKTSFQAGVSLASAQWRDVATEVPSGTLTEDYSWLQGTPGIREWIGDRLIRSILQGNYQLTNKDYEATIEVRRNAILDDQYGVYSPMFSMMGMAAEQHKDVLVYAALAAGFAANCYDGQYFFDTDHPRLDAAGNAGTFANTDGGSGTAWFLIDDRWPLKPIILQMRQMPELVAMDNPEDEGAFMRNSYRYGTHGRYAAGYGLPQTAWGSKQTLNAANYATARAGLLAMKTDGGHVMAVMPNRLIVPPTLESAARAIVSVQNDAAGAGNPWYNTAQISVVPFLA